MKKLILSIFAFIPVISFATGIYGSLVIKETKAPIAGQVVILCDTLNSPLASVLTNTDGAFGFDIPTLGYYNLIILEDTTIKQEITQIPLTDTIDVNLNILVSGKIKSNSNLLTSRTMEKTPARSVLGQINGRNGYYTDGRGELRSIISGGGITYIIDGQVSSSQAAKNLVPGSIENVDIKAR